MSPPSTVCTLPIESVWPAVSCEEVPCGRKRREKATGVERLGPEKGCRHDFGAGVVYLFLAFFSWPLLRSEDWEGAGLRQGT